MSIEHYLEIARRVIAKAEKRREIIDLPCCSCKYCKKDWMGESFYTCSNPIVTLAAASCDDRLDARRIIRCAEQRSTKSVWGPVVCGPHATLFEAR